jgi:RNA polymerase-binding transcription factor
MPANSQRRSSGSATGAARRAAIRRRLVAERDALSARVRDGHAPSSPPEVHQQPSESPIDSIARDVEFMSREAVHSRLVLVNEALERLESSAYGECLDCGEAIEPRRLDRDPAAALCVTCQTAAEGPRRSPTL